MTYKNKIFGLLSVSALMLTASCSDNADLIVPDNSELSGKTKITFMVNPQGAIAQSRAGGDEFSHISDGTKADKLVYAVYRRDEKGAYQIVTDYLNVDQNGQNTINNAVFPVTIELVMDVTDEFTVAFWAQSSECEAYDTSNLAKVKVDYSKVTNNYELGDAFCNVATVKGNDTGNKIVELRRPFAQINVGDAGWDYEAAAVLKPNPRTYAKSSISMTGLAQYYNVLEGRTLTDEDLDVSKGEKALYEGTVTFNMAYMPAFINLTNYDANFDWSKLSYLPYSEEFGPKEDGSAVYDAEIEEFLKIKWDGTENPYKSYLGYDADNSIIENFDRGVHDTEHYKYLSMCYVLVPVSKDESGKVKGATINKLSFTVSDAEGKKNLRIFSLDNVPVQQNWRTNIVSDRMFMGDEKFKIFIVPTYAGDFNNASGSNEGSSKDNWNNVEMDYETDSNGNQVWYVKDVDKGYGNPNDDFNGYGDQDGQYDEWDKTHGGNQVTD